MVLAGPPRGGTAWSRSLVNPSRSLSLNLESVSEVALEVGDRNSALGYAIGVEAGQRFTLDGDWSLTPQAQLVYSSIDFQSFTDR